MWKVRIQNALTIIVVIQQYQLLVVSDMVPLPSWEKVFHPRSKSAVQGGADDVFNIFDVAQESLLQSGVFDIEPADIVDQLGEQKLSRYEPTLFQVCKSIRDRWGNDEPSEPMFKQACNRELDGGASGRALRPSTDPAASVRALGSPDRVASVRALRPSTDPAASVRALGSPDRVASVRALRPSTDPAASVRALGSPDRVASVRALRPSTDPAASVRALRPHSTELVASERALRPPTDPVVTVRALRPPTDPAAENPDSKARKWRGG